MVKELLLGDNPFIGVSHLAHEKARETMRELTLEKKVEIIRAALKAGATGFTFSTHPLNLKLLDYLKNHEPELLDSMFYYILVPYVAGYVREANKVGVPYLVKKTLLSSIRLRSLISLFPPSPVNLIKLFIEAELESYLRILPRDKIRAVLLHEVLTELIVAFNLVDVARALSEHFRKKGIEFGFETRNINQFKEFIDKNALCVEYIMTPLNPLGYQMTILPIEIREYVEWIASKGTRIIAINVLASGALSPTETAPFLKSLNNYLHAIAIGTSKISRANELFSYFKTLLLNT